MLVKIVVDVFLCLSLCDVQILCERKITHAVYYTEIDRLGACAQQRRYLIRTHTEDIHCRGGVDVRIGSESRTHIFVSRHMCHYAQLYL